VAANAFASLKLVKKTWLLILECLHQVHPPGPDLAGGGPGAQPNYGSISLTGASLGAHKTRGSRSPLRPRSSAVGARIEAPKALRGV